MPTFRVTSPDGVTVEVNAPEGATQEQAISYAQSNWDSIIGSVKPTPAPISTERTWGESLTDLGASLKQGLGGLMQFPGQMYGLATGAISKPDFADTGLYGVGKRMEESAQQDKSAGLKAREAASQERVAEADKEGFWSGVGQQLKEIATDPVQLPNFLLSQSVQSLPSIIVGMVPIVGPEAAAELKGLQLAAKAATVAAKSATTTAAKEAAEIALKEATKKISDIAINAGTRQAIGVGAMQQGADIGSGTYEDAYKKMISDGVPQAEAASKAVNLAREAGASGAVISVLVNKFMPGANAFERAIAGERTGAAGRLSTGLGMGLKEGLLSEAPEEAGGRMSRNVAMMQIDPNQTLMEGVGSTTGQAIIGGFGLGAVTGGATGGHKAEKVKTPEEIAKAKAAEDFDKQRAEFTAKHDAAQAIEDAKNQQAAKDAADKLEAERLQRETTSKNLGVTTHLALPAPSERVTATPAGVTQAQYDTVLKALKQEDTTGMTPDQVTTRIHELLKDTYAPEAEKTITAEPRQEAPAPAAVTPAEPGVAPVAPTKPVKAVRAKGWDTNLTDVQAIAQGFGIPTVAPTADPTVTAPIPAKDLVKQIRQADNAAFQIQQQDYSAKNTQFKAENEAFKAGEAAKQKAIAQSERATAQAAKEAAAVEAKRVAAEQAQAKIDTDAQAAQRLEHAQNVYTQAEQEGHLAEKPPTGFDIQREAFKEGEAPGVFEIKIGDTVIPFEGTEAEANAKVARLQKVRDAEAAKLQKQVDEGSTPATQKQAQIEQMEAMGKHGTPEHTQAVAEHKRLLTQANLNNTEVAAKLFDLTRTPISLSTVGNKPLTREGHTVYENGERKVTLPTRKAAEEHILTNASEEQINALAQGEHPWADRAKEEVKRRKATNKETGEVTGREPAAKVSAETQKAISGEETGIFDKSGKGPAHYAERAEHHAKIAALENLLKPLLKKLGLENVSLDIVSAIKNGADGSYAAKLIKIAFDTTTPIRTLRHEGIHALKELGFFSDQQWKALEDRAKKVWVNQYLKGVVQGEGQTRYDAYVEMGLTEQEILEEAIADAFADFDATKAPPGMIAAILNRMRLMINHLKSAFTGAGYDNFADVFGKVEKGELKAGKEAAPGAAKAPSKKAGIVAEVAPHPDQEVAKKWRTLTPNQKLQTTKAVTNKTVLQVLNEMGLKGYTFEISSGKYEGEINPNIILSAPEGTSIEELSELSRVLGYVLDQKAMVSYDEHNTTSDNQAGFVKVFMPKGMSTDDLNRLRDHIAKEVPQADSDTLRDGNLLYGNFSEYNDKVETLSDQDYHQAILGAVESFDYAGKIQVSEPNRFHSELTWPGNREEYLEGTRYGAGRESGSEEGRDVRGGRRSNIERIAQEAIDTRNKWIGGERYNLRPAEPTGRPDIGGGEGRTLGTKQDGSISFSGVHYGKIKTDTLLGSKWGTGLQGAEARRLESGWDDRIKNRVYFYIPKHDGTMPAVESGVGGHVYTQTFNNIIPPSELSKIYSKVRGDANEMESAIVDAGYDGYAVPSMGMMVILNHDVPVDYQGNKAEYESRREKLSLRAPDTKEFKQFFGDSKVVDADGNPLVVYHGTKNAPTKFSKSRTGSASTIFGNYEVERHGIFAAESPELAEEYANQGERPTDQTIMPLYLSIKNPLDTVDGNYTDAIWKKIEDAADSLGVENSYKTARHIGDLWSRGEMWKLFDADEHQDPAWNIKLFKKAGFDGLRIWERSEGDVKNTAAWVAFEPTQVKSATGNTGAYSKTNPDIRYSLRAQVEALPNGAQINTRVGETTYARVEKGHVERMLEALTPKSFSSLRQKALHRYNQAGVVGKQAAQVMGDRLLLADASAEAACLFSDNASSLAAEAMGVGRRKGGIPQYIKGTFQAPDANGVMKTHESGYFTVDSSSKGAVEIFAPLAAKGDPIIYQYYNFWAGVQRGSRFMADGTEQNFTPADIAYAKQLETLHPEFASVQKEWIKYNDGLVKMMVDAGVITKEAGIEFTKHGDYLPFYRQLDGEATVGPNIFQSIAGVKPPKKHTGKTEAPIGDFLENVVRNTQAAIEASMKNVAGQRVLRDAETIGQAHKVHHNTKMGIDIVPVFENGVRTLYQVHDALLIEAMKGLNLPQIPFLGIVSAPANLLRTMVTKDPAFMLANMMRDSLSAWVTTGASMKPMVETIANFGKGLAGMSPEVDALRRAGILGGYDFAGNVETSGREFSAAMRKFTGTKTKFEKGVTPITGVWHALEMASDASEGATRAAVYKATLAKTGNEAEALFQAMEVLNFNRKGNSAAIRLLTAAVPFLNARMQGLDLLYRAGFGQLANADAKAIQKSFFIRGATIMALSALYYAMTHDDDDYKKQEQETRDNYWLLPSLGVKIPIPFEVGIIFKVIPERIMAYAFGSDTGQDFLNSMGRQISTTLMFNPVPQAAMPIVETVTNHSFFTGRPVVSRALEGVAPEFQVEASTSGLAKRIGKGVGLSPIQIDHLISGYTGTMGMYMVNAMNTIFDTQNDPTRADLRFEQLPVWKRFALDKNAKGNVTSYYDLKHSTDEMTRTINMLERTGNYEEMAKYQMDNVKLLATQDYIKVLAKDMKQFQDMKMMVQSSKMDGQSKRDTLTAINQAEIAITGNIQYLKKMMDQMNR